MGTATVGHWRTLGLLGKVASHESFSMSVCKPLGITLLGALAWASCSPQVPAPALPRHILMVTVDGLRADHCSFMLYPRKTTGPDRGAPAEPFSLDGLAQQSTVYAQAFSPSPHVNVSLATLMTGANPLQTGIRVPGDSLNSASRTIAEVLSALDYETCAFVSRASASLAPGLERGLGELRFFASDESAIQAAGEWLMGFEEAARVEPFFLWLHLEGPQLPMEGGAAAWPGSSELPKPACSWFADPEYVGNAEGTGEFREGIWAEDRAHIAPADARHFQDLYDGELTVVSARLAAFFQGFHDRSPATWAETGLVVCGVRGMSLPVGDAWPRVSGLEDDMLGVPLLFHGPGRWPAWLLGMPWVQPVAFEESGGRADRYTLDELVGLQRVAPSVLAWLGHSGETTRADNHQAPLPGLGPLREESLGAVYPVIGLDPDRLLYSIREEEFRLVASEWVLRGGRGHMRLHPVMNLKQLALDTSMNRIAIVDRMRQRIVDWVRSNAPTPDRAKAD